MTADNLGYSDLGCYGDPIMKTPHLNQLAKQGVRCTSFYTASPTCTVSRATLLTGRYPQRIGLNHQLNFTENYGKGLNTRELLIPYFLKQQGYKTACFGKWNIGFAKGYRPTERGFDTFFGFAAGNIDYYHHVYSGRHDLWRGTEEVHVKGYSTDLLLMLPARTSRRIKSNLSLSIFHLTRHIFQVHATSSRDNQTFGRHPMSPSKSMVIRPTHAMKKNATVLS